MAKRPGSLNDQIAENRARKSLSYTGVLFYLLFTIIINLLTIMNNFIYKRRFVK